MNNNKTTAKLLKVLGHPARLRILRFLLKGPSCATLTNQQVDISQPNLSQHLKTLTDAGILAFCRIGTKKCFYIAQPEFVKELFELFDNNRERVILNKEDLRKNYVAE